MTTPNGLALCEKIFINGEITTLTGMHIGGNSIEMSIGGADKIVVRDPLTNRPYIPGSSLRGKMRCLLEKSTGAMKITARFRDRNRPDKIMNHVSEIDFRLDELNKENGLSAGPSIDPDSEAARLFGIPVDAQKDPARIVPQRLMVRDAALINHQELAAAPHTDMPYTEVKTEVAIDRITCIANPRQFERVPAGARFDFQLVLNLYDGDSREEFLRLLFGCMEMLQDDYLGGQGSRGYGRVKVSVGNMVAKTVEDYRAGRSGQEVAGIEVPASLRAIK